MVQFDELTAGFEEHGKRYLNNEGAVLELPPLEMEEKDEQIVNSEQSKKLMHFFVLTRNFFFFNFIFS